MKKTMLIILAFSILAGIASADWQFRQAFIIPMSVGSSATKANGTDFTSSEQVVLNVKTALLTITLTRAAGSSTLTCDFYFQVSFDNGTTWADYIQPIGVETGHAVISGTTVAVSFPVNLSGASHIRLSKIVNNDSGNNLTAVGATISW